MFNIQYIYIIIEIMEISVEASKIVWISLNVLLLVEVVILIIIGKWFRKPDIELYVS